jgi:predicted nucleic acid-binding protein
MKVVLDASAAAEIAKRSDAGIGFVNALLRADEVAAPDLYVAEISNVMWKLWRNDRKNKELYREMASDCIEYVDKYFNAADLWREALATAQTRMHPVYDMLYAILAKRLDAKLLTADQSLKDICKKLNVRFL